MFVINANSSQINQYVSWASYDCNCNWFYALFVGWPWQNSNCATDAKYTWSSYAGQYCGFPYTVVESPVPECWYYYWPSPYNGWWTDNTFKSWIMFRGHTDAYTWQIWGVISQQSFKWGECIGKTIIYCCYGYYYSNFNFASRVCLISELGLVWPNGCRPIDSRTIFSWWCAAKCNCVKQCTWLIACAWDKIYVKWNVDNSCTHNCCYCTWFLVWWIGADGNYWNHSVITSCSTNRWAPILISVN